jgi:hypothetical protein
MADASDLIHTLREGKELLRRTRRNASLDQKLHDLWRAQHIYVQLVGNRRPLRPWERPWNIMSAVREAVIIRDGAVQSIGTFPAFSASRSHWVRPRHRLVL